MERSALSFMQIKVAGKGIDIGNSLRVFSTQEISNIVDKYVGEAVESSIVIKKDNRLFKVEIVLHVSKGFIMKTNGASDDPYKAVSLAIERLESKIKKHKNRLMDRQRREHWIDGGYDAKDYTIERKESNDENHDEEHLIIAEQEKYVLSLSVSEAVTKLDLGDLPVVMFKNMESGRINIVYKRPDGHIGWLDYKA